MIEKLTEYQKSQFSIFRDKWIKRGLSTERIDKNEAIKICHDVQEKLLGRKKTPVVVLDGIYHTWIATCLFSQSRAQVNAQVNAQVRAQVYDQVRAQVQAQVYDQVSKDKNLFEFIYPWLDGNFEVGYFSYIDYMLFLGCKITLLEKHKIFMETSKLSYIYPLKDICFVSEKPEEINLKDGRLHADNKPAVKYADGFCVWALHGVRVPKEIVLTPAEKLDAQIIPKEPNAEVRREIVRKIGIERVCQKLNAKVLDRQGDVYELLNLDLGEKRVRPYLKMRNPSIGTYHIEGVSPECKTVEEALNWRNQTVEKPIVLT